MTQRQQLVNQGREPDTTAGVRQEGLVTPHATAASATEHTNPQALIHIVDQQSAPAKSNNPQKLQPLPNRCGTRSPDPINQPH
ncbi:hypothetical protein Syncc8109_2704 [Synechococcus sp. WH 8109]|nr:hypothetical protein Syncc8109_2704 [Synechococcus sp. WH 8109]